MKARRGGIRGGRISVFRIGAEKRMNLRFVRARTCLTDGGELCAKRGMYGGDEGMGKGD